MQFGAQEMLLLMGSEHALAFDEARHRRQTYSADHHGNGDRDKRSCALDELQRGHRQEHACPAVVVARKVTFERRKTDAFVLGELSEICEQEEREIRRQPEPEKTETGRQRQAGAAPERDQAHRGAEHDYRQHDRRNGPFSGDTEEMVMKAIGARKAAFGLLKRLRETPRHRVGAQPGQHIAQDPPFDQAGLRCVDVTA